MKIEINTFDMGTTEEKARKVCEEAMEFYAEHHWNRIMIEYTDSIGLDLMMEIGDVFTALANYCVSAGIDPQACVDKAERKNALRGRYDD